LILLMVFDSFLFVVEIKEPDTFCSIRLLVIC
jgi:hypothetical protein